VLHSHVPATLAGPLVAAVVPAWPKRELRGFLSRPRPWLIDRFRKIENSVGNTAADPLGGRTIRGGGGAEGCRREDHLTAGTPGTGTGVPDRLRRNCAFAVQETRSAFNLAGCNRAAAPADVRTGKVWRDIHFIRDEDRTMTLLITGLVIFLAVHSISIVNDDWRNRIAARLGEWTWQGIYALFSLVGLVLIIRGYALARMDPVVLYTPPQVLHIAAAVLLLPVFPLLFAAYLPGRIRKATRHPMLVATKLWAAAHLLANGTQADLLLFGGFLIWAVADRISLNHRTLRPVPGVPETALNDALAVVLGLGLYTAFVLGLHRTLIGVPVIAG